MGAPETQAVGLGFVSPALWAWGFETSSNKSKARDVCRIVAAAHKAWVVTHCLALRRLGNLSPVLELRALSQADYSRHRLF